MQEAGARMGEIVTMHVFGQEYELRINTESGRERLEIVAELVDRKMKDVAARYVSLTTKEVAVLAALNLADDYIQLQERLSSVAIDPVVDEDSSVRMLEYAGRINAYLGGQTR